MSTVVHGMADVYNGPPARGTSINGWYLSIKRLLDLVLATLILVVTSPFILISMILVRLSSRGPMIYAQNRLGQEGCTITIYKIRTMYQDAERDTGAVWSRPGDPRVTPIGRFLRWAHLDELPQLVNILRGEMSLVGPRPERAELAGPIERALPTYRRRLSVRPGLTGLAQVQQGPDMDLLTVSRKLSYDLYYVKRMCFWLDVRVLIGTALKCSGVPFGTIGRILRLPGKGLHFERESPASGRELTAQSVGSTHPTSLGPNKPNSGVARLGDSQVHRRLEVSAVKMV
jgi:lipopolysaccharide/colanic/teichoic acid biosynthesis glycosyltransferase